MKKGLLISTTLAMLLGVGVAIGAHQAKGVEEVKAEDTIIYCKVTQDWWNNGDESGPATVAAYYWGGSSTAPSWPGNRMEKVTTDYRVWKATIPSDITGLIFVRVNQNGELKDWGAKTGDLSLVSGKNLYTVTSESAVWGNPGVTGEWGTYSEDPVPADGYYIVGTESNWKYAGATKMSAGSEGNKAELIGYEAKANESFKVRSYLSGVDTWYGENYDVGEEAKSLDIYLNNSDEVYISEHVEPDIPAEEGYYICGEFSSVESWTYENASKMVSPSPVPGNVANLMNFYVAVGDKLRVRSYYTDRDPHDQWAKLGNGTEEYGKPSKSSEDPEEFDNFEFTKAGYYDIYAYYENDVFTYYVAEHVDSYTISMHGLKYAGKDKVGNTIDFADQTAYSTSNFEPAIPDQEGYVARGVYYDEECTVEYQPKKFGEADDLYIKYTKLTSYLTGDDTFLGEGHGWDVDYSTEIGPQGTNKYVGTVVVPEGVDADHPMKVKPLEYVADTDAETEGNQPGWGGIYFTPGYEEKDAPDFVSIDEKGNFSFIKPGTYAFYVNSEDKVWFNGGEYAFHAAFLTQVGGTCDSDGKSTDLEALSTLWSQFETAFGKLSPEEQKHVKDFTIDGGDEKSSDDCLKMIAMYSYIVHKYGTEAFKDFIWGGSYPNMTNIIPFNSTVESNNAFIVVAVIASITTLSTAVLLVIKKRKRQ